MLVKAIPYVFLLLMFAGCNIQDKSNELSEGSKAPTFEGFLSELYADTLPYELDCNHMFSYFDISFAVYEQYIPKDRHPYAKFEVDSNFTLMLFTFMGEQALPVLYSFDELGNRVDSLDMFIGRCQDDFHSTSMNYFVINEDFSIVLTDTTRNYFVAANRRTLNSSTLEKRVYHIDDSGKFELVSGETVKLPIDRN